MFLPKKYFALKMFLSINKILPLTAKRLKMGKRLEIEEILSLWSEILKGFSLKGKEHKARPSFIKNKTLFIECPNAAWASELQSRQKEIVERINKKLGKGKIERIKLVF